MRRSDSRKARRPSRRAGRASFQAPARSAINEPLTAKSYFVYARSSLAHSGTSRAWGGTQTLCVKDATFALRAPLGSSRCPTDDTFELPFAGVDTHRQKSWTMTFDENPPFKTLKDAEGAGLKRLLRDQGAKSVAAIDAKPDKAVDAAMAAFRKRLNMNPKASTSDLFDALETEALKTTAPAGYAVCNDTTKAIWAALGLKNGDKWLSRGWWKIAAGGCAKAIVEALSTDKIFLLAQTPGGIPIVYGPEKFCTTGIEFEIQGRAELQVARAGGSWLCRNAGEGPSGIHRPCQRERSGHHAQGLFGRPELAQVHRLTMLARGGGFAHLAPMQASPAKAAAPDFRHVEAWIFDLDNTLYRADSDLFAQIDARMCDFVSRLLDVPIDEAKRIQKDYYRDHGTTLNGLIKRHDIDPESFLDFVHDIDLSVLAPDPALNEAIARLPGKRFVFTNGCRNYAQRVLERVGLEELDR